MSKLLSDLPSLFVITKKGSQITLNTIFTQSRDHAKPFSFNVKINSKAFPPRMFLLSTTKSKIKIENIIKDYEKLLSITNGTYSNQAGLDAYQNNKSEPISTVLPYFSGFDYSEQNVPEINKLLEFHDCSQISTKHVTQQELQSSITDTFGSWNDLSEDSIIAAVSNFDAFKSQNNTILSIYLNGTCIHSTNQEWPLPLLNLLNLAPINELQFF